MRLHTLRFLLMPALVLGLVGSLPDDAAAQRRVRAPIARPAPRRIIVRGGLYGPIFFDPWYSYGFGYGYGYGYGFYPQFGYPYPPYGYAYDSQTAEIRLDVTPKTAEVYVDGYRAGTVDDFDGVFQRLRVRPGEHDIVLYQDGYRTKHEQLYLGPRTDQKIRFTMVPLPAGEQAEPRPRPEPPRESGVPPPPPRSGGPGRGYGRGAPPPRGPVPAGPPANAPFGSVSIRVQPTDVEVLIDGEPWTRPADQDRLVVQLPVGSHHVEVRKDGYETYSGDFDVAPGDTTPLNVSLLRK